MMLMYSIIMFFISIIMFFMGSLLYLFNMKIMLEWFMLYYNSVDFLFLIYIDYISILFISVVSLISSMVLLYSVEYMKFDNFKFRYTYLLLLFVMSMFFMILSPNLLSILLGWDGLGLISYCLVIYYQNNLSYNSGMLTILCNRVGDVGILMSIGLMFIFGSWMMFYNLSMLVMMMVLLASLTKSAQIPFSPWLPAAMAAPTPISALVHSSTLVTAGVYLLIRFNEILMISKLNIYLLLISSLTMFMSGLMANFEFDLKKIIALSTLSQLGLMMSILSVGIWSLSYFHLLIHALFKSLLFLCAGILIHLMNDNQDIRFYGGLYNMLPFLSMVFFIANLSLCGFPFLSGFYSKDLIMEMFFMMKLNKFILLILMISTILTVSYTFRLMYFLMFGENKFYMFNMIEENLFFNMTLIILMLMSIMGGSILMWMFFYENVIVLSFLMKVFVLILCVLGLFLGYFFMNINMNITLMMFILNMFNLLNFYSLIYLYPLFLGKYLYMFMEKGWIENLGGLLLKKNFIQLFNIFMMKQVNLFSLLKFFLLIILLLFIMM